MIYVGIDVAKDKHDCCIIGSDGEVLVSSFTIQNTLQGFDELYEKFWSLTRDRDELKVGLEATGHYHLNLLRSLLDNGLPSFVINPLHTNLYRKGQSLRKTKTDKVDAASIAMMLLTDRTLKPYSDTSYHNEELKSLTEESLEAVLSLTGHPKCCAIGEIGLDYYWDDSHKEEQKKLFHVQLSYAKERDIPVIVHDREAHGDCLAIVKQYPGLRGVFHCYSGSPEMAQELLRMGWYLGFDGPVTYKNAKKALEVLRICPDDRIVVETDSPYLPPVPMRGKRNDPSNLRYICAKIAEIKESTIETIAKCTAENGKILFGL